MNTKYNPKIYSGSLYHYLVVNGKSPSRIRQMYCEILCLQIEKQILILLVFYIDTKITPIFKNLLHIRIMCEGVSIKLNSFSIYNFSVQIFSILLKIGNLFIPHDLSYSGQHL